MLLHERKIAVVVQQRAAMLDAKRADDDVRGLPDRYAEFPQFTTVPGGARGQIGIEERHERKPAQFEFDARRMGLVPSALKNFEQDEIADQDWFASGRRFQFGGRVRARSAKVDYPDGAVDKNHNGPRARPRRISSRSPSQPNPLSASSAWA